MRKPRNLAVPLMAGLLLPSCKAPPAAPAELDELCAYLYTHLGDEDPAALQAGLANLDAWLHDHLDETLEGYAVSNLDPETIGALPERRQRDVHDLQGAAVGVEDPYDPYSLAWGLVMEDPAEVFAGDHLWYERTYVNDPDCFMSFDCEILEAENEMEDAYPLGIQLHTRNYGQYRWIELETGTAMVHRTWFREPVEANVDWLSVEEQFYLNALLPDGDGTLALQAMWVEASLGDQDVPESFALNLVIGQMQEIYGMLDAYLDEHGTPDAPPTPSGEGCASAPLRGAGPLGLGLALLGWALRRRGDGSSGA